MKGFHYLLMIGLALSMSGEAKGEDMKSARIGEKNIMVRSEEGKVRVIIPFSWKEHLANVEIWVDPVPKEPSVMPYVRGKGTVGPHQVTTLGLVYDFKPEKVTIKIKAVTQDGKTYVDTQTVRIPEASRAPSDKATGQAKKHRRQSGTEENDQSAEDTSQKDGPRLTRPQKLKATIDEPDIKARQKDGVYNYRVRAYDEPITSVVIGTSGPTQLIKTPDGWRCHQQEGGPSGGAITCGALTPNDAIKPGRALLFQVSGSPNPDNVPFVIMGGGGKITNGTVAGPGN